MGGNETPLINVVIQEVYRDGIISRDGRLLAGDQILQVSISFSHSDNLNPLVLIHKFNTYRIVVLWNPSYIKVSFVVFICKADQNLCLISPISP